MTNIYDILENAVQEMPQQTALVFGEHKITYEKLKEGADRLAAGLARQGVGANDRFAIMLPNVPHFVISYFALLKLGAALVPVSIHYKAAEIHHQLEDSEVRGIIYWEGFRETVHQAVQDLDSCKLHLVLGESIESGEQHLAQVIQENAPLKKTAQPGETDTALILYTAGSTGRQRGAELTHFNILSNIQSCIDFLKLKSEDGVIGVIPLYHILGQTLILGTFFFAKGRIILLPKFDTGIVIHAIEKNKPTYFAGVPSMYREFLQSVDDDAHVDLSSIKFCLSSGDSMDQKTMETFQSRFNVRIIEGYGLTEASPMVSFNDPQREIKAGSIGLPLPGVELRIVDEDDQDVRYGQVGEIIVKGPNVMKGYLNRPEATKKALRDGWLRTGDLARMDESGYGFIVVRKKNVIVKSGFNVYPREVEKFLSGHPSVKETVVFGVPDTFYGEEIEACVVLKDGESVTYEEISKYLQERLANYKCPGRIHFMQNIPKGPTGRVIRDKVREKFGMTHNK